MMKISFTLSKLHIAQNCNSSLPIISLITTINVRNSAAAADVGVTHKITYCGAAD